MGIDLEKFVHRVDDELKCSICCGVLENAVQISECEHTFCSQCIEEWIKRQPKCPIDRRDIVRESLRPATRLLNSFLSRLEMRCDFRQFGCHSVITYESFSSHKSQCNFNPEKTYICEKGCGVVLTFSQKDNHNCVLEDILTNIETQNQKIRKLEKIIEIQNKRIDSLEQKRDSNEVNDRKYEILENRFEELVTKVSSLGLISNHFCDISSTFSSTEENSERSFAKSGDNLSIKSKQRLGPMRAININVDHKNKTIQLWANIREPIRNIKYRIKDLEDISVESQCLLFGNQLLDNDKTLEEYSIRIMDFVLVKRPIKVDIILFSGNICYLLEPLDQISRLKDKIYDSKGFKVTLSYFGQILDDNRTFHSYKIRDRAKLKVTAIECDNNRDGIQCNGSHKHSNPL